MEFQLHRHPDCPTGKAISIVTHIEKIAPQRIAFVYRVSGDIDHVAMPIKRPATRTDDLWHETCFEAFLAGADEYIEFNFSPSTQWAAYHFDGYRRGMRAANEISSVNIVQKQSIDEFELTAIINAAELPRAIANIDRIALSTVIKDKDGAVTYFALAHPQGTPDFHHPDCFTPQTPEWLRL